MVEHVLHAGGGSLTNSTVASHSQVFGVWVCEPIARPLPTCTREAMSEEARRYDDKSPPPSPGDPRSRAVRWAEVRVYTGYYDQVYGEHDSHPSWFYPPLQGQYHQASLRLAHDEGIARRAMHVEYNLSTGQLASIKARISRVLLKMSGNVHPHPGPIDLTLPTWRLLQIIDCHQIYYLKLKAWSREQTPPEVIPDCFANWRMGNGRCMAGYHDWYSGVTAAVAGILDPWHRGRPLMVGDELFGHPGVTAAISESASIGLENATAFGRPLNRDVYIDGMATGQRVMSEWIRDLVADGDVESEPGPRGVSTGRGAPVRSLKTQVRAAGAKVTNARRTEDKKQMRVLVRQHVERPRYGPDHVRRPRNEWDEMAPYPMPKPSAPRNNTHVECAHADPEVERIQPDEPKPNKATVQFAPIVMHMVVGEHDLPSDIATERADRSVAFNAVQPPRAETMLNPGNRAIRIHRMLDERTHDGEKMEYVPPSQFYPGVEWQPHVAITTDPALHGPVPPSDTATKTLDEGIPQNLREPWRVTIPWAIGLGFSGPSCPESDAGFSHYSSAGLILVLGRRRMDMRKMRVSIRTFSDHTELVHDGTNLHDVPPQTDNCYAIPMRPEGPAKVLKEVFTGQAADYYQVPADVIGRIAHRLANVWPAPTLETTARYVWNEIRDIHWLQRIPQIDKTLASARASMVLGPSIRIFMYNVTNTLGTDEIPWQVKNPERPYVAKLLANLFRRKNRAGPRPERFPKNDIVVRPQMIAPPDHVVTDDTQITASIQHAETMHLPDEESHMAMNTVKLANVAYTFAHVSHSYSSTSAAAINVHKLRQCRPVLKPDLNTERSKMWSRAVDLQIRLLARKVRLEIYNTNELATFTDVPLVGNHMIKLNDGKWFSGSLTFNAWYLHLDTAHRRVYTEVIRVLQRDNKLTTWPDFSKCVNKLFVKVEVAPRDSSKTTRPRVITYMEHSKAIFLAPTAWACYSARKTVMHAEGSNAVDTSGLTPEDITTRVMEYIADGQNTTSERLVDNIRTFVAGDDNLCLLARRLNVDEFKPFHKFVGREVELHRGTSIYQSSYCSRDFFRTWNAAENRYEPKLMLKPLKQLSKLPFVKLTDAAANMIARGNTQAALPVIREATAMKCLSLWVESHSDPFIGPLCERILQALGWGHWLQDTWASNVARADAYDNERQHKLRRTQFAARTGRSNLAFYDTYLIRYGVTPQELEALSQLILKSTMDGLNGLHDEPVELSDPVISALWRRDIKGCPDTNEYTFPEGLCQFVEADCSAYDTTTNAITQSANFRVQRAMFGKRDFIDALEKVRTRAKVYCTNPVQKLKTTIRYQMLSGHADTSAGNGISNVNEIFASMIYSYPQLTLNVDETRAVPRPSDTTWRAWATYPSGR